MVDAVVIELLDTNISSYIVRSFKGNYCSEDYKILVVPVSSNEDINLSIARVCFSKIAQFDYDTTYDPTDLNSYFDYGYMQFNSDEIDEVLNVVNMLGEVVRVDVSHNLADYLFSNDECTEFYDFNGLIEKIKGGAVVP